MRAILMYHSIDESGSPISVSERRFGDHVRFLASGRVRVVPLRELVPLPDEADAVAITFDDGFSNFESSALPRLTDHALPATVFAVADHVGRSNAWERAPQSGIPSLPLMGWEALARVARQGVEVGAHSRRHPDLTTVTSDDLTEEIDGSAESIAAELGTRPTSFAYPYGRVTRHIADAVRKTFDRACTTELRLIGATEDRALLPRIDAYYVREAGQLESWGTSAFRRRLWIRGQGRRVKQLLHDGGVPR